MSEGVEKVGARAAGMGLCVGLGRFPHSVLIFELEKKM